MKNKSNITRRGFLKLSGTVSAGLVLSSCGLAQTSTTTPTLASTPKPIASFTNTPSSTGNPTPTATPNPETLTYFFSTHIDTDYLIRNGSLIAKPISIDVLPQPSPVSIRDATTQNTGALNTAPDDYTAKTFVLKEFDPTNPMHVLDYAVAQGTRLGIDGVAYYQEALNGEIATFSGLSLYREKTQNPVSVEYTVQEGYPTGLILRDGAGITVVGKDADGNVVIAFEELVDRGNTDFFSPRVRYASVHPLELGRIGQAFLLTMEYSTDKPDQLAYTDSKKQVRTVQFNSIDPSVMVELEKEIKGNWVDKYEDPKAENGFTLHPAPFVRIPNLEKDEIPEGMDTNNLIYTKKVSTSSVLFGRTKSVSVWAKDKNSQESVPALIANYYKEANDWRWTEPTQRDIGELIGYEKGVAWDQSDPNSMYKNPNLMRAADEHFSVFHPIGSFMPYAFEGNGKDLLKQYPTTVPPEIRARRDVAMKRSLVTDQRILIGLGWTPADTVLFPEDEMRTGNISDVTRENILKYEERVIREVLYAVKSIRDNGGKPPIFYLTNEILYGGGPYHAGGAGYYDKSASWSTTKDPHSLVHGRNVFKDAWLKCREIAEELGLKPDEYRIGFGDFNMNQYHEKTNLLASELARTRTEISLETGLKSDEIQMDVLMQCRSRVGDTKRGFDEDPPTEEQMTRAVQILKRSADKVHFIEVAQMGMTPEQMDEYFLMLDRVAMSESVASCTYWKPLIPKGVNDNDANGASMQSPLLFSQDGIETASNRKLTYQMIEYAKKEMLF